MKKWITPIAMAFGLGLTLTSCEAPQGSLADTDAQTEMDRKSYEVSSFEVYNHVTEENYDIAAVNDHVYLTFKDNDLYLTKENDENGTPTFRFDELTTNFEGGAIQGIYLDEYHYMKVVYLKRTEGRVVAELEGQSSEHNQFTTVFLVMDELPSHPAGALQISGLPG